MTNWRPPWGTMASSGTAMASGLTANTAVARANMPGRKGPSAAALWAATGGLSPALGGHRLGKRGTTSWAGKADRLVGAAAVGGLAGAPAGLAAGFGAALGAAAAGAPAGRAPAGRGLGSPPVLGNSARTPMERPLASIKGSMASTLARKIRFGKASSSSSTDCCKVSLPW